MLASARAALATVSRGNAAQQGCRRMTAASKSSGEHVQDLASGEDLAPFKHVFPAVAAGMAIAFGMYTLVRDYKIFGGSVPSTLTQEWREAEEALSEAKPREGAPDKPAILNPIRKGYVPNES